MLKCEKYKGDVMLQKTYTEDYLTGKRKVNYGQSQRCYVTGNHEEIISPEIFQKVQNEMFHRARVVFDEEREQISTGNRYSSKYLLGNLLKCENCGASYYPRTERGKIVWRCGKRMEKGKEVCGHSPTLQDDEIKRLLGKAICDGSYSEVTIKDKIKRIDVYEKQIIICVSSTEQYLICQQ